MRAAEKVQSGSSIIQCCTCARLKWKTELFALYLPGEFPRTFFYMYTVDILGSRMTLYGLARSLRILGRVIGVARSFDTLPLPHGTSS